MGRREDADTSPFRSSIFPHAPHSGIRARAHPRPNSRLHHRPRSPNKVSAHTLPNQAGALQGFRKEGKPLPHSPFPFLRPRIRCLQARASTHRGGGPLLPGGPDGSGLRPLPAPARPGPRPPTPPARRRPESPPPPAACRGGRHPPARARTHRLRPARLSSSVPLSPARSRSAPLGPAQLRSAPRPATPHASQALTALRSRTRARRGAGLAGARPLTRARL